MKRPAYLENYLLDWDYIDVIVGGASALDKRFFSPGLDTQEVGNFLRGYGFDPNDHVSKAELFGNFQEAIQFIKRYFLKEGNPAEGVDLRPPNSILMLTDVSELFVMATGSKPDANIEERLWSEIILKIMHTIIHVDKDLRVNYFPVIQTQVFDRFYKFIYRDDNNQLYLGDRTTDSKIKLIDFQTKAKKSRDSVIIKLLHKAENVAEELFDRIGIRFVTEGRFDILRIVKFLVEKSIVIPHNIKPSRSINTLIDIPNLRKSYVSIVKDALRNNISEKEFNSLLEEACQKEYKENRDEANVRNTHTSKSYKSVQFTCRQLIRYRNPFFNEFSTVRQLARKVGDQDELAKKILELDLSLVARDIRFFYPFEVQIADIEAHKQNTEGEASHQEYKKAQLRSALRRLFRPLLEYKGIDYKA